MKNEIIKKYIYNNENGNHGRVSHPCPFGL